MISNTGGENKANDIIGDMEPLQMYRMALIYWFMDSPWDIKKCGLGVESCRGGR